MPSPNITFPSGTKLSRLEIVKYHDNPNIGNVGRVVIALLLIALGFQFFTGWSARQNEVIDQNKANLISGVINALNEYYRTSSDFLEQRSYPIARCSNDLNSFDYEYTLRSFLTGRQVGTTSHAYIAPNNFPTDPQGAYRDTIPDNFACADHLSAEERNSRKYFNGTSVCDFDINQRRNCFLYTSSLIGDSFKLAYWSPFYSKYVVFSKFREDTMKVSLF